jgi:hypothetical protein
VSTHPHQRHLGALVRALRENGRLLAALAGRCEAVGLAPPISGATFRRPADIAAYLGPEMAHLPQEQLRVVLLDRRNRLIDAPLVYQGGQTETAVRLAECFREAVRCAAAALVLVHCHPSGDPNPSPDDVQLTHQAGEAGALLGIGVLDHVVIAADGFVSLREAGLYIPPPPPPPPPPAPTSVADSLAVGSSTQVRVPRGSGDEVDRWTYDCRQCGTRMPGTQATPIQLPGLARGAQRRMTDADRESRATELVQPAAA